jgi:hypothetical protein
VVAVVVVVVVAVVVVAGGKALGRAAAVGRGRRLISPVCRSTVLLFSMQVRSVPRRETRARRTVRGVVCVEWAATSA